MMNGGKRKIELIEYVGLFLVAFSFLMLVVNPGGIGNLFNNMFNHAAPIIIKVYITGSIGIAIIISVTMGRLLERLGFTDALMRIFVPLMKVICVNAAPYRPYIISSAISTLPAVLAARSSKNPKPPKTSRKSLSLP